MPTELKSINDFYKPPDLGAVLQNQRGIEQLDLQRQQMEQQGQQSEIVNAMNQFKLDIVDNPLAAFASYNKSRALQGLAPETDVNKFIGQPQLYYDIANAKTPEEKAAAELKAASQGNVPAKRGLDEYNRRAEEEGAGAVLRSINQGDSPSERVFYSRNNAASNKLAEAALDVRRPEQMRAIQLDNEHKELTANVNTQLRALVPLNKQVQQSMKDMAPQLEQIRILDQQFEQDSKNRGSIVAEGMRTDRINANDDLKALIGRAKSSQTQLQGQIQQEVGKRIQRETQISLLEKGVIPSTQETSLPVLKGLVETQNLNIDLMKAKLAFAKSPTTANVDNLSAAAQAMADHEAGLGVKLSDSEARLAIRREALDETVSEHKKTRDYTSNIGKAQAAWMESGGDMKTAHQYAKQYGVKVSEVTEAAKDPNKPLVTVDNYDRKQSIAESGRLANINQSISEIQAARRTFVKPDGSIDRVALLTGAAGIPGSEGRTAALNIEKATEVKLRAATGAEAKTSEIKKYTRMFAPSALDSDDLIRYKLDSFENWMQTVADTTDPEGALRKRSEELLGQGTIQLLQTDDYKYLRKKYPQASTHDIVQAVQKLHAQEKR